MEVESEEEQFEEQFEEVVEDEYTILCRHQIARLNTYNENKEFIDNLDKGKRQKRYRKDLKEALKRYIYAKEDDKLTDNYTFEELLSGAVKPFFNSISEECNTIIHNKQIFNDFHCVRTGFFKKERNIMAQILIDYGVLKIEEYIMNIYIKNNS